MAFSSPAAASGSSFSHASSFAFALANAVSEGMMTADEEALENPAIADAFANTGAADAFVKTGIAKVTGRSAGTGSNQEA